MQTEHSIIPTKKYIFFNVRVSTTLYITLHVIAAEGIIINGRSRKGSKETVSA